MYLVFFVSSVVDVPKGLSVALRPFELSATVTLVICVVVPFALTLKSAKVAIW